jgi:hypothetical protein
MPDLAITSVLSWLRIQESDKPDLLTNPVRPAESHPDVEVALGRLGESLDHAFAADPIKLAAELRTDPGRNEMRMVIGQLGMPRTLRLLGWVMQEGLPESDAVIGALLAADPAGNAQFLQATLSGSVRPTLLERLYAPDRLAALLAACQHPTDVREAS